jgi:hypothetical protein
MPKNATHSSAMFGFLLVTSEIDVKNLIKYIFLFLFFFLGLVTASFCNSLMLTSVPFYGRITNSMILLNNELLG